MITIEDNAIFRDGESIGTIEGDTATLTQEQGGQIKGQINKAAGVKLTFALAQTLEETKEPEAEEEETIKAPDSEPLSVRTGYHRVLEDAPPEPQPPTHRSGLQSAKLRVNTCPPFGPMGDKTPSVIEWLREHGTEEEFDNQYGGRNIGK